MQIEVEKIPKSKTFLVPVASENINDIEFVADIRTIKHKDIIYDVFDYFVIEKGEPYQRALMKLALGVNINQQSLFNKYQKSERIFLFVCDNNNTDAKIAQKEEKPVKSGKTPSLD